MLDSSPDALWSEFHTESVHLARFALLAEPTPLFAILDAARDDDALDLLARSGELYRCLLLDPTPEDLAYDAPYLVAFSPGGTLLADVLARGWGQGWLAFFASKAPFDPVFDHFEDLLREDPLVHEGAPARIVEPRVLAAALLRADTNAARRLFGPAEAILLEGARPDVLVRFSLHDGEVRVEEVVLSLPEAT